MRRVQVVVRAADPGVQVGLTRCLESQPEVLVVSADLVHRVDVVVVAGDQVTVEDLRGLYESASRFAAPTVLVTNELAESDLLTVVGCRVVAVLPQTVTGTRLATSVLAAAHGGGVMPPNLLGVLLRHVRQMAGPRVSATSVFTPREIDVLRLLADGWGTSAIAAELGYSEHTVKGVLNSMMSRLKLRNRSHAVAYALRAGMI
ncbi:response regulator transcription factor [Saccharopolyspora sp. NPDC003752]